MFLHLPLSFKECRQGKGGRPAFNNLGLLLTVCCCMWLLSSCKRFLDTKPVDSITPETYYKTKEDLDRALSSVYDRLGDRRTYGNGLYGFLSFSDEFFIKGQPTGYMSNTLDASMLELNRCWEALYVGIERANMLIERVGGADVHDSVKNEIKGQALFLRGFYYFVLADNWGGVPLKLTYTKSPLEPNLPRAPLADVYAQVVQDMKDAEGLVKNITTYGFNGRISKTAVQGMLARVYLTMAGEPLKDESKYAEAQLYAQKVIDSKLHALNPSFSEVFINLSKNRYDIKETLWEVEYFGNNQEIIREGGYVGSWMGVYCPNIDTGFAYDYVHATAKLYSAYEDGDLRRDWTIAPYRFVPTGSGTAAPVTRTNWTSAQIYERSAGKYRREYEVTNPKNQDFTCINFPMLRYSDVLLMYAEAESHVVGATPTGIEYVNKVRRRGFGKPAEVADPSVDLDPGIVSADFLEAIKKERFRELSYEGLRKHDLLRWGTYVSTMQQQVTAYQTNMPSTLSDAAIKQAARVTARSVLFPIPNTEIAVNPYVSQNPGW
ncbi:RagB/SusD family nutrient uptake outer membrane protein [Paraflavitalea sp. CAU 1676]|uniref:RagB/SusD family nutrient uptake outer membrane protein n=1 Tax=Paraflavitalea sp. CAU 1676 TaxID=3032598 RepID=UPI0023DB56A3|nr:RagB/SusD family nutrient uptake outer membrane protein [Paraflavitalea sp. CAU 1676]MDF2192703.1 RagB/SusD family nutrient uptake outer membrane protein [Paraflavitalea sp. CAU 1676]